MNLQYEKHFILCLNNIKKLLKNYRLVFIINIENKLIKIINSEIYARLYILNLHHKYGSSIFRYGYEPYYETYKWH